MFRFFYFTVLALIVVLSHFYGLNTYPPDFHGGVFFDRLFSASYGAMTVFVICLIAKQLFKDDMTALSSGLFLTLMPWHIEQSRIVSKVSLMTLVTTIFVYLLLRIRLTKTKIFLSILFLLLLPATYKDLPSGSLVKLTSQSASWKVTFFKLLSAEFLFFENQAFGIGALKSYGVMLWFTLPIFLIGLLTMIRKSASNQSLILLLWFGFAVLLTLLNPLSFGIEFYIATPLLALILASGFIEVLAGFRRRSYLVKILTISYCLFIIYGFLNFWHFYTSHYTLRIMKEPNYAHKRF